MTAPKQSFAPPYGPITDDGQRPTQAYEEFHDRAAKALEIVRQAGLGMTELDTGTATTADIATVLNALRAKLQEIV